jgi:hypothetical protein
MSPTIAILMPPTIPKVAHADLSVSAQFRFAPPRRTRSQSSGASSSLMDTDSQALSMGVE